MTKVVLYSVLLLLGLVASQTFDLSFIQLKLTLLTMICLAYIMIEVGLEFVLNKNRLSDYGIDYLVAMTAAAFPWFFCALYFYFIIGSDLQESFLIGRFAAPTSAGVLFTMLGAVGLGTTWLFKKARILAIFDDLDTIMLMLPLQMMIVGFKKKAFLLIGIIFLLLYLAYRYLHEWKLPTGRIWLLFYSVLVAVGCWLFEKTVHMQLEVLLPAFVLGCVIYNPHDPKHPEIFTHEHAYIEPTEKRWRWVDYTIKNFFMFLVGASMPKMNVGLIGYGPIVWHVAALTLLSNLGKMFPSLCYKKEATLRERLALSIAMFPRGEVGAGVLLLALGYHLNEEAIVLGGMSLILNLALTGVFIITVIKLIKPLGQYSEIEDG